MEYLSKLNEMAGHAPDEEIDLYEVCFLLLNFFLVQLDGGQVKLKI